MPIGQSRAESDDVLLEAAEERYSVNSAPDGEKVDSKGTIKQKFESMFKELSPVDEAKKEAGREALKRIGNATNSAIEKTPEGFVQEQAKLLWKINVMKTVLVLTSLTDLAIDSTGIGYVASFVKDWVISLGGKSIYESLTGDELRDKNVGDALLTQGVKYGANKLAGVAVPGITGDTVLYAQKIMSLEKELAQNNAGKFNQIRTAIGEAREVNGKINVKNAILAPVDQKLSVEQSPDQEVQMPFAPPELATQFN